MRHYIAFVLCCFSFFGYSQGHQSSRAENTCGLFSPYQIDVSRFMRWDVDANDRNNLYTEMELALGNETVNRLSPEIYLQIEIFSTNSDMHDVRPLNLCLVLDRSASMSENGRMEKLKIALKGFVKLMKPADYFSIVVYDERAFVLMPSQRLADTAKIFSKIDDIELGGGTNVLAGMLTGYAELRKHYSKDKINRLILMSDGMSTVGETLPREIMRKTKMVNEGIETSIFGLGADINFEFLTALANDGKGLSHFIGDCDSISGDIGYALQEEMDNMVSVMDNVSLTLEYPKNVGVSEVYGCDFKETDQGRMVLKTANIAAGEKQVLLAVMKVKESQRKPPIPIKVTLEYTDRRSGETVKVTRAVKPLYLRHSNDKLDALSNQDIKSSYLTAYLAGELKKSLSFFWSKKYDDSFFVLNKCYYTLSDEKALPDNKRFKYLYRMLLAQRIYMKESGKVK